MTKLEHQTMFIAGLREFTGKLPSAYSNEKDFFMNTLHTMSEHLVNLKKETLKEACVEFLARFGAGNLPAKTIEDFKSLLEKLVSEKDYAFICGSLIGKQELLRQRLESLKALSLIEEEKRPSGKDPDAEKKIKETYSRLHLGKLLDELGSKTDVQSIEKTLKAARAEVAEYCCLYHIPLEKNDTFTPFTLAYIDAAIAATYRFFSEIRKRASIKNPGEKLVLIADDDEQILQLLEFTLAREGFQIAKAADGAETINKAKTLKPDLILLDMMMPKYSGLEVIRELQDSETTHIPIIVITARVTERTSVEMIMREPNVKDFMEKPVKPPVLTARVHALLTNKNK